MALTPEERRARKLANQARYRETHREELRQKDALYRETHKEGTKIRSARHYILKATEIKQYRDEHKAERSEYDKKYRAEHKERRLVNSRSSYALNPEKAKARRDKWDAKNKERKIAASKKWGEKHPEAKRFHCQARRARVRNASGADYITIELLEARWDYYGRKCYLCGAPAAATDHVKPVLHGGTQWPSNLRPICQHCNSVKGSRWPYDIASHKAKEMAKMEHYCGFLDLVYE